MEQLHNYDHRPLFPHFMLLHWFDMLRERHWQTCASINYWRPRVIIMNLPEKIKTPQGWHNRSWSQIILLENWFRVSDASSQSRNFVSKILQVKSGKRLNQDEKKCADYSNKHTLRRNRFPSKTICNQIRPCHPCGVLMLKCGYAQSEASQSYESNKWQADSSQA